MPGCRLRMVFGILVTLLLSIPTRAAHPPAEPYDLVIRGGKIDDGTGNPWFAGDVAISGDRIAKGGHVPASAPSRREIDARGLVIAPGVIDMTSHSAMSLLEDG